MKSVKTFLPVETVQQNILATAKCNAEKIGLQIMFNDAVGYYLITTTLGAAVVTPKQVYVRDNKGNAAKQIKYLGQSFEFNGVEYVPHPNKKQVETLKVACGFKKVKETSEVPLWQQLKEMFPRFRKDQDAKNEVNRIEQYLEFTKKLLSEFTVHIYVKNEVLHWHYYKGFKLTFTEGRCDMLTDISKGTESVDNEFLLPMLQTVYGKPIERKTGKPVAQVEYSDKELSEVA